MGREAWEPVYGLSRFYEVSSDGRVRNRRTAKVLVPTEDKDGYLRVHLYGSRKNRTSGCEEEVRKSPFVHRLVATAFVGARPGSGYEVGHRDGDRQNNHQRNLDWVTKGQNARQRKAHGNGGEGVKNPAAKLTDSDVLSIRKLHTSGARPTDLARDFGVSRASIYNILRRDKWQHL
jgi:hypothetical protein